MAEIHDVMAYIIQNYPSKHELSNARLTKMVYLADWRQAISEGRQISTIKWYFDNFGPFVRDVETTAAFRDDLFATDLGSNMYGQPKKSFTMKDTSYKPKLSSSEKAAIDHIIEVTKRLYWKDFIKLVYSTHPIASSERYSTLDLVQKAKEYGEREKIVA
ncbi:hypothetical protein DSM25558_0174 [Agrobacterium sp. DSM 25558]|uniref:Panacea domain-containing protein n=1 Tax=Agrobacterium sp. DSM 25558 TaxID=1907665 RepID=UPI0009724B75|nr:Panacea domain-containing protein [Agrobacterium sp. DSM 25558]SCX00767.1 hypothetical protein DSM25558_0174 [Agrobacterium sp. DSM 25558]